MKKKARCGKRFDDEPVVIGLFPYASDARRAVHALHEADFTSEQIIAAFRAPVVLQAGGKGAPAPVRGSGKWSAASQERFTGETMAG